MKTRQGQGSSVAPRSTEWPLVVFTTLAILGAGLLAAPLVAAIVGPAAAAASPLLLPGTALLAAGLLVSLAHLGQPRRAPLALARAGRSRLSNEIVLASITLAAGAFASGFPYLSPATTLLPSACAVAFLVSLGLVYALPGQLAWRGPVVASPLPLGLGFASVALVALWDGQLVDVAPFAALVLAADVGLLSARVAAWRRRLPPLRSRQNWSLGPRLFVARSILVDVLPGCLLLAGLPKGAAGFLGLGVLVDRLAFYLLAVQHTTESEIAGAEALMAGEGDEA